MANDSFSYKLGDAARRLGVSLIRREPEQWAMDRGKEALGRAGSAIKTGAESGFDAGADFAGGFMNHSPETQAAIREYALGRSPSAAPRVPEVGEPWSESAAAQPWGQTQEPPPVPMRSTDPKLRATQDAAEATAAAEAKREAERRTIRKYVAPDGKVTYTNVGNIGTPVIQGGESVADVGKPGGALSMDTSAEARAQYEGNMAPEAQADLAEQRYRQRLAEILTKNPFAREQFMTQMNNQAATDRALLGRRWDAEMLGAEAELESERDAAHQEIDGNATLTPEQKAQAKAIADREIQLEGLRRGIKPRTNPLA